MEIEQEDAFSYGKCVASLSVMFFSRFHEILRWRFCLHCLQNAVFCFYNVRAAPCWQSPSFIDFSRNPSTLPRSGNKTVIRSIMGKKQGLMTVLKEYETAELLL